MKRRCAGMVAVLFSLLAFGKANAEISFYGVLNPSILVVHMDSVTFPSQNLTWLTPEWSAEPGLLDTFHFYTFAWPQTLGLHGTANAFPFHESIIRPKADIWYPIILGPPTPAVMFYGYHGVEESEPMVQRQQSLTVSPSVVTRQMTVRLQPVGTGRQVVQIHDAAGNVVRSLDCMAGADGMVTATWNREDGFGRLVPEGVYFCRYAAPDVIAVRKVLVAH